MVPTPAVDVAEKLFADLRARTSQGRGIVRDSYGPGEQLAHALVRAEAAAHGLEIVRDPALNLYMTLPGRDRAAPALFMGSHLDSVPQGGNYDGASGVVAGLAAVVGLRRAGMVPRRDITVMAIRAEEAAWFDGSYIGTHAAFGALPPGFIDSVRRSDTGRSMADHLAECGGDVAAVRRGERHLRPERVGAFVEVHIEQGPVLEGAGLPLGIVSGIRGCRRFRNARCYGGYSHSGAQPRRFRRDAVAATVALISALQADWVRLEEEGKDLTFTVGELTTDPAMHGPSKVSGETRFVLDFRSLDDDVMAWMRDRALALAAEIGRAYDVRFDLGEPIFSAPALLDQTLRARFAHLAQGMNIPAMTLASGAGHDASVFANFGIPAGMLFIRNANGSHNPDEAMDMADFAAAVHVLTAYLAEAAA